MVQLTFVCAQPASLYYAWQVEVMLEQFRKIGIQQQYNVHVVLAVNHNIPNSVSAIPLFEQLESAYSDVADFFYYEDTRQGFQYLSSVRPHILKQHWKAGHIKTPVFYHDCDIVFTKFPDFVSKYTDDDVWYVSDTISYLGHDYILSKGQNVLDMMTEIVGIHPKTVQENEKNSGGAQYILKNVDWHFWDKVEKDSEALFKAVTEYNNEVVQKDPKYHPLQIWCADMWAVFWNALMRGFQVRIIPEMDFVWPTHSITDWDKKYIYHNSGVQAEDKAKYFYKNDFTTFFPYMVADTFDQTRASYRYFQIIQSLKEGALNMHNVKAILQAYSAAIAPSEAQKETAEKRLSVCITCENFKRGIVDYCELCTCPIRGLVFIPKGLQGCKENKWPE